MTFLKRAMQLNSTVKYVSQLRDKHGICLIMESDIQSSKNCNLKDRPHTRRGLLSLVSSIFDLLGFLAPVILLANARHVGVCTVGMDTCQMMSLQAGKGGSQICNSLRILELTGHEAKEFWCTRPSTAASSEDTYGTTSYLPLCNSAGEVQTTLMMAKARVAPLKSPTIPRMELEEYIAATVAVKMDKRLKKELEVDLQGSIFWMDSTAVLKYLNSEGARFKTFVANRISVILSHSEVSQWRYVNTTLNPADHVSRGLTVTRSVAQEFRS